MSRIPVKLLHDKDRSKIRYANAVNEFEKAANAHADQATFKKTTTYGTKKKRRYPTIYVGSNQRLTLQGDVKAVEIESALLNQDSSIEPRLADVPDNNSSDKVKELGEENQELRQEISDLESRLDDTKENVNQNAENIEAIDEKTDRMIEQFTEVSNQIMDRLDEIGEKQDSGKDRPEQIRNRRE